MSLMDQIRAVRMIKNEGILLYHNPRVRLQIGKLPLISDHTATYIGLHLFSSQVGRNVDWLAGALPVTVEVALVGFLNRYANAIALIKTEMPSFYI